MIQITEDYVSYETAKLLTEKGFDYYPDGSYWLIDANNVMYWVSEIGAYDYVDVPTESFQRPKNGYRLVTQAMAMKWLRNIHNIIITVRLFNSAEHFYLGEPNQFTTDIATTTMSSQKGHIRAVYSTYEQACEEAIKFCLKNLV